MEQRLAAGHAQCAGGFHFTDGDGVDGTAQDFGDVGRGVQGHGQQRAPVRVAQVWPERSLAHALELGKAVVDDKQLQQQRRAAKEEDVGVGHGAHVPVPRGAGDAQRYGEAEAGDHGDGQQLQGQGGALEHRRQPFEDQLEIGHSSFLTKPRPARRSRKCRAAMMKTVRPR